MRGNGKVSPQKIKNAPGVPSTEGVSQIRGDTNWRNPDLRNLRIYYIRFPPETQGGESYAMQEMPFRSTGGG